MAVRKRSSGDEQERARQVPARGRRSPRQVLGAAAASLSWSVAFGCNFAPARFSQDVAAAIADGDMQRLETEELVIYYPRAQREQALGTAARLDYCHRELQKLSLLKKGPALDKPVVVFPDFAMNNAYVAPRALGQRQIAVLPTHQTATSYFELLGMPADAGSIGCHELTHDMAQRQISGAAAFFYHVFGNGYTPSAGFDPWWQEGLAVYYETKLQGLGRDNNRYFEGVFAAGVAQDGVSSSLFRSDNRAPTFGHYLLGAHMIDFLARKVA